MLIGDECGDFIQFNRKTKEKFLYRWACMKVKAKESSWLVVVYVYDAKCYCNIWWEGPALKEVVNRETWASMVRRRREVKGKGIAYVEGRVGVGECRVVDEQGIRWRRLTSDKDKVEMTLESGGSA